VCRSADDVQGSSGLVINYPTPLLISNLGLEEDIAGKAGIAGQLCGGRTHAGTRTLRKGFPASTMHSLACYWLSTVISNGVLGEKGVL
jgi:hypothetical protein